jgi:hypothetical protein
MAKTQIQSKGGHRGSRIQTHYVMNPSKGLDNFVTDSLIDDKEASAMLNCAFRESGVVTKRNGFQSVTNSLVSPKGLGTYYTETVRELITVDNGQPKKMSGNTWVSLAGVPITANVDVNFTQARGKLFMWDGVQGGVYYDGTTVARPGTMPKATFGIFYKGFHLVAGVTGQRSRLFISQGADASVFTNDPASITSTEDPDNPTSIPGATVFTNTSSDRANFIDIAKDDGDAITGLGFFQDSAIIFKDNSIWQMTFNAGTSTPVVQMITNALGCVSHRSIDNVQNDLYFLSRRGIFVLGNQANYYTAIRTNELTARVRPVLDTINPTYFARANGFYYKNVYHLGLPINSSVVTNVLAYDDRYQAWMYWDTINPNYMTEFVDSNNNSHFYFLPDGGNVQLMEIIDGLYSDNGAAISAYWQSKACDLGAIDVTKRWEDIGIVLRQLSGSIIVSVYTDGNTLLKSTPIASNATGGYGGDQFGSVWFGVGGDVSAELSQTGGNPNIKASTLTSSSTVTTTTNVPYRVVVKTNSRTIKFKIENNNLNETFAFLGYILAYKEKSRNKFDSSRKLY